MMEYVDDFIIFLVSLFAIANPFFTVPVFISLTRDQGRGGRSGACRDWR